MWPVIFLGEILIYPNFQTRDFRFMHSPIFWSLLIAFPLKTELPKQETLFNPEPYFLKSFNFFFS